MKNRWERMNDIFEVLYEAETPLFLREILESLEETDDTVNLYLIATLLKHYFNNGYLKRAQNPENHYKYEYSLTEKGISQYENFLKDGDYKIYQEVYPDSYKD